MAIVGAVGTGKSSLIAALMGEMVKLNGIVNLSVCFDNHIFCNLTTCTRYMHVMYLFILVILKYMSLSETYE